MHWEYGVLATGPPGKSQKDFILNFANLEKQMDKGECLVNCNFQEATVQDMEQ